MSDKDPHLVKLGQNAHHIQVLAKATGLEKADFYNVVLFIGDATLKTKLPENVLTNDLPEYIRYQNDEMITARQLEKFSADVDHLNLSKEAGIGRKHIKSLRQRKI